MLVLFGEIRPKVHCVSMLSLPDKQGWHAKGELFCGGLSKKKKKITFFKEIAKIYLLQQWWIIKIVNSKVLPLVSSKFKRFFF